MSFIPDLKERGFQGLTLNTRNLFWSLRTLFDPIGQEGPKTLALVSSLDQYTKVSPIRAVI